MVDIVSQELQNWGLKPSVATYSVTLDDLTSTLAFLICQMGLVIPFVLAIPSAWTTLPLDSHTAHFPLLSCLCSLFTFSERLS